MPAEPTDEELVAFARTVLGDTVVWEDDDLAEVVSQERPTWVLLYEAVRAAEGP